MGIDGFPLWRSLQAPEEQQRLLYLLLVATVLCILITRHCWKRRRFWYLGSKLPGPTALPIVGNGLMFASGSLTEVFKIVNRLSEKYGPVVRIWRGPNLVVFITDVESIEKIMTSKTMDSRGPLFYRVAKPVFGKGLILSYGKLWKSHRKIVTSTLHNNILDSFVDDFSRLSIPLCDNLSKFSDGTIFDLYPYAFFYAIDVVAETTMGEITNVQISQDNFYTRSILFALNVILERFRKPWLLIDRLYYLTKLGRETKTVVNDVHTKFSEMIIQRMRKFNSEGKKKTDLEDRDSVFKKKLCFMDLMVEDGTITVEEIRDEATNIMGAGSETLATTFCYVMSMLGLHGAIQDKVFEEQKEVFGEDFLRPVRAADVSQMTYLEQVIRETQRLFPSAPFLFRYTSEDIEVGLGYTIPAGSEVMINIYKMQRNPEYYPDPEVFNPDRFSAENALARNPYTLMPFGGGRRMCVGHKFAIVELKAMLSTVLRRYRIVRVPGGMEDMQNLVMGLVAKPATGFPIQIEPRSL